MNSNQLKTALKNIINAYDSYSADDYINDTERFKTISDLNGTCLQACVDDIERLLCEERPNHVIKLAGVREIYDGGAVEVNFAIAWIEINDNIELETFGLSSEY